MDFHRVCVIFSLADGFSLAEGVGTILLQKLSVARRNYATIVHVKSNTDGYKEAG